MASISINTNLEITDEDDFCMLKFPHKLWRIVNECGSGAISWGIYGNTILIDFKLFQTEYLRCQIPKFKTRNMASFVRQLNMYGFKKIVTDVKNFTKNVNVHEFYHNSFRAGRYDLLDSVRRRPTFNVTPKGLNHPNYQTSRVDLCRVSMIKRFVSGLKGTRFENNLTE